MHTVLVDMRERLRRSDRPNRIFETVIDAARTSGLIGRRARVRGRLRVAHDFAWLAAAIHLARLAVLAART